MKTDNTAMKAPKCMKLVPFAALPLMLLGAMQSRGQTTSGAEIQAEQRRASTSSASKNLPFDHHDLSGIWWGRTPRGFTMSAAPPPPMTPWAQERFNQAKPGLSGGARSLLGTIPSWFAIPSAIRA